MPRLTRAPCCAPPFLPQVNDYLARRDCEWVGQVHRFLGLSVGLVQQGMTEKDRRAAYASDITYVTNSEVGFDYLRDNLATSLDELARAEAVGLLLSSPRRRHFRLSQHDTATAPLTDRAARLLAPPQVLRDFNFCVIDEVDSILIDEARTPLIISGPADKPSDRYITAAKVADAFQKGVHYKVDEKQRSVTLSEEGYEAAEELLQVKDLYDPRTQWALYIINALKAKELQKKDVNYIVKNGEIIIVDEFTGRTMQGRRWSDGLHQAVEAKEGVAIQNETITIASVTYQSFFRCGGGGAAALPYRMLRRPVACVIADSIACSFAWCFVSLPSDRKTHRSGFHRFLPPQQLQQALRHDGHRRHRGDGVRQHLQPHRSGCAHQPPQLAHGLAGRRVPPEHGEVERGGDGGGADEQEGPPGARGHHLRGAERDAVGAPD